MSPPGPPGRHGCRENGIRSGPLLGARGGASRAEALALLRQAFAAAGLDSPALDARILAAEALGLDPAELVLRPDMPLGEAGARRIEDFAARRLGREPVARILGRREFWGLSFELSPETLEPRPDTETVVETALALLRKLHGQERLSAAPLRLLDLGTGSGCLLVALLAELPRAEGFGLDRSFGALATARRNAGRNGVGARARFAAGDWAAPVRGPFELVVANPPYIPSGEVAGLAPEVRLHDPRAALDGGPDGLDACRAILLDADRLLAPGGGLVVEIGAGQEAGLRRLAAAAGLRVATVARDLGGHPRAVAMTRPS